MSKTNFDDLDLQQRGIEAGEINSETAAAGTVLTADGVGGAMWQGVGVALLWLLQDNEDTINTADGSLTATHSAVERADAGWSYDPVTGHITVGSELDGKLLLYNITSGIHTTGLTGYYHVHLRRAADGVNFIHAFQDAFAVLSDMRPACPRALGWFTLTAGERYKVMYRLADTSGTGSGTVDSEDGVFQFAAF